MSELLIGIGTGLFVAYSLVKIRYLEKKIENLVTWNELNTEVTNAMPSPEEIAKEVIKVKLPVSDLPEDIKEGLEKMKEKFQQDIPLPGFPSKENKSVPLKEATYIG